MNHIPKYNLQKKGYSQNNQHLCAFVTKDIATKTYFSSFTFSIFLFNSSTMNKVKCYN